VTREEFARRLHEATQSALGYARELLVNEVPDDYRFDIVIKPDWLPEGPRVAPELMDLWERSGRNVLREVTADQAVAELWHAGRVPEWIDISLDAIELPRDDQWRVVSFVLLRCSRTLADDDRLWHAHEGLPPFHMLSPALPPGWSERHTNEEGRFDPQGAKFLLPSRKR
jgi:hypothetical protein